MLEKEIPLFEEIMNTYADMVTHIALLRMGNEQDAKDIFQTVFLKLYETKTEFHDENHRKAWLIQTTIHACIDEHRKFWKRHRVSFDESFSIIQDTKEKQLLYDLMELPVNQRNALYLYYYEGYPIHEISKLMYANENTVKSWMRRGKEALRISLGGEEYE